MAPETNIPELTLFAEEIVREFALSGLLRAGIRFVYSGEVIFRTTSSLRMSPESSLVVVPKPMRGNRVRCD